MAFPSAIGKPGGNVSAGSAAAGAKGVKKIYSSATHRNTCMHVRDDAWFGLYTTAPQGARSMQEFEEAVLRRFEMLTVLHQEEGLDRLQRSDLIDEISLAAKGEGTRHCKGVFEWVAPQRLESDLLAEEVLLRQEHGITPEDLVKIHARRRTEQGMYSSSASPETARHSRYEQAVAKRKVEIVEKHFSRALDDDSIAHWACKLACCGDEKWRTWFLKHEETLFRGRIRGLPVVDQQTLLRRHTGLEEMTPRDLVALGVHNPLAEMEVKQDRLKLLDPSAAPAGPPAEGHALLKSMYYAVDCFKVPSLVRQKAVLLRGGVAYVNHTQALNVLYDRFKEEVEKGLLCALRVRPDVEAKEGDRVSAFLTQALGASMQVINRHANANKGPELALDIEDIAQYADLHMPLCMRAMDRALRTDRHLKFHGRFQYGLFLKHAGLTLEKAMKFFSETMTLKVTTAKFPKSEFGYSIRHWYGREGKKTSYNALNCATVITGAPPGVGQVHGCPFKHYSESRLKTLVREPRPYGTRATTAGGQTSLLANRTVQLRESSVQEIVKKTQSGHYSAACREYFIQTHPGFPKETSLFLSPNHYLEASLEFSNPKEEKPPENNPNGNPRTGRIG